MFAQVLDRFGQPEVLEWRRVVCPRPADDEVLLKVDACGVNHLDLDIRSGTSGFAVKLPHILGREIVGTAVDAGAATEQVALGRQYLVTPSSPCGRCQSCQSHQENLCSRSIRPGISRPGGYSEFVAVPARALIPVPVGLS